MKEKLTKIWEYLSFSLIISTLSALAIVLLILWNGIWSKFITGNEVLPYEINRTEFNKLIFTHFDKNIVDTVSTMFFWLLLAIFILFTLWVVKSTYIGISNIVEVEVNFENKTRNFLRRAIEHVVGKAFVAVFLIMFFVVSLKTAIPVITENIASHLLAVNSTLQGYGLAFIWFVVMVSFLEIAWQLTRLAINFLKESTG